MKVIITLAIILCAALIAGGVYFSLHQSSKGPRLIPLDPAYTQRVKDGGWVSGASKAKVQVIEYGDLQCPACGHFYPLLKQSLAANADLVQFTFRHFPLPMHNKAVLAAKGAEAAGRQGKFWQMEDLLYTRQAEWADDTLFDFPDRLNNYAKELGLNVEQFKQDVDDSSTQDQIDKDVQEGARLPVSATPTLIVNGTEVQNIPTTVEGLNQLIQQAAQHAPTS